MTKQEAISKIRIEHCYECYAYEYFCEKCEYGIAIECVEKQMPKPVVDNEEVSGFYCPTCGRLVVAYNNGKLDYCHRCGQKLNWGDVE